MFRYITFFTLFFCLIAPPSFAKSTHKEGAERLKTLFSNHIDKRKKSIASRGGNLKTDGDIVVEIADDYYAITLPAMTMTNAEGMQGEIGLIAINATPTDNPDNWKMSIAIPTPILYKDKEGKDTMRLDIGAQEMGGIWNGNLQNFSKLSAHYSDLKLNHFQKQEVLLIEKFSIATDLKEGKQGLWSGPTKISVTNVSVAKPDGIKFLELKQATTLIAFENFSPQKQIEALTKITKKDAQESSKTLSGAIFKNLGDSFSFQTIIKGLTINSPDIPTIEAKGLSLDNANISFSTSGLQNNKIKQSLKLNYDGLKTKESKNKNASFVPSKMSLNLSLDNLPLEEIIELAEKILPSSKDNKASKQVAALQAMITLPKILSEAGTILTLSDTNYGNDIYNAHLNGTLKANPRSIFGATGDLIFTIDDIGNTLKKLSEKENQQVNITKLKTIQNFCQKETKETEKKTSCHITLDESAKLSVNGQDLKALLKALSGSNNAGEEALTPTKDMTADH